MDTETLVDQHYGSGGIMEKIVAGLKLAGRDLNSLTVDDLAPIDAFHTRGRASTLEVAELGNPAASDLVLDVGCGLGGTARHLANTYRCHVTGIDLTEEYVAVGNKLTEFVGLDGRVELHQASALALPFETATFDLVWTEHVQMNIEDKVQFYSEIARVLKPGGRFLFHDVFRGLGATPAYPVPWAENPSICALATETEARSTIERVGLTIERWIVKTAESVEFFQTTLARIGANGPPPLGIHILMGDNAGAKLQNYVRNLSNDRVSVALGMARKNHA